MKIDRRKILGILNVVIILALVVVLLFLWLQGGKKLSKQGASVTPENKMVVETQPNETPEDKVEKILGEMTLDEKIYQMMFVTPESITGVGQVIAAGDGTKRAIEKYPVGGIIYFAQNIQNRDQVVNMISNSQGYSEIPLFIGVDEEGGRVTRLGPAGVTVQPPMREIGNTGEKERAFAVGETLGKELSELGFNVDFAPVADVQTNEANTVIGDRAFGTEPQVVSNMVGEMVKGLQANGVSATLKHFPGHGSTSTDSHTGYSESARTMEELKSCEFLPFKAGIEADTDFVMIAHITMVNATEEKVPATLSKELLTGVLRGELGFEGIIITDSFRMGAITQNYTLAQATVKAVDAGVDMILMPENVSTAHAAIKEAVENGTLTEERINESVRRILTVKEKRGILED